MTQTMTRQAARSLRELCEECGKCEADMYIGPVQHCMSCSDEEGLLPYHVTPDFTLASLMGSGPSEYHVGAIIAEMDATSTPSTSWMR